MSTVGAVDTAPAWRFGLIAAAGAVGTSSIAPALNDIASALSLGEAATAGVLSAYVVPYAAATIVAGQLCDAHGPRRVLQVALSLAVIGAAVAAAAGGAVQLLLGRVVQGIGAGAVTMGAFDVARRQPAGIAKTAAVLTLGASLGPLAGGLSSQLVGWQLAVLLPGLLHATGLVLLPTPDDGGAEHLGVDGQGIALTGLGAATGATGLQVASALPVVAAGLGLVAVVAFVAAGRRSVLRGGRVPPAPVLVEPALRLRGGLAASIAGTYFASLVLVPVALGRVGFGAIGIGLLLLPPAVSGAVFARRSDAVARVLGRWTDAAAAVTTVVVLVIILTAPPVAGALALLGLAAAYGIVQPRLLAAVASRVQDGPATAIGTANLLLLLGGGIGSAMVGGLGRALGGVVLAVLVGLVAIATVREAATSGPLQSQPQ